MKITIDITPEELPKVFEVLASDEEPAPKLSQKKEMPSTAATPFSNRSYTEEDWERLRKIMTIDKVVDDLLRGELKKYNHSKVA